MTPIEEKNYFSTIKEQLQSKNVVTFKWLSRKFKIHCTTAKQLLNEFLNESGSKNYSVTYIVFSKGPNGSLKISLSDENDLNNMVDDTTVVDKQIYSIECSSSDISTDDLYTDDKLIFQLEQMNLSSINYPMKVGKKLNMRRLNSSTSTDKKNFDEEKVEKSSSFSQKVRTEKEKKNFKEENVEKSTSSSQKVELKKEKVNKLTFTALPKSTDEKSANKTQNKSPKKSFKMETESKVSNAKTSKLPATSKGSLSTLFQNHRVKSTSNSGITASKDENIEMKIEDSESEEKHDCSDPVKEKPCEKNQSTKRSCPATASKEKKPVKKSATKSKKKPEKRKQKRITMFESSSDESASDVELSEKELAFNRFDEEPEPEPEEPVEPEPNTSFVQGKKRKRKVISKMAMGDDGFFYTDKQVVYESCDSDDNDENDPNANQEANKRLKASEIENGSSNLSKTRAVSPISEKSNAKSQKTKTKQASIMNFFKKS